MLTLNVVQKERVYQPIFHPRPERNCSFAVPQTCIQPYKIQCVWFCHHERSKSNFYHLNLPNQRFFFRKNYGCIATTDYKSLWWRACFEMCKYYFAPQHVDRVLSYPGCVCRYLCFLINSCCDLRVGFFTGNTDWDVLFRARLVGCI